MIVGTNRSTALLAFRYGNRDALARDLGIDASGVMHGTLRAWQVERRRTYSARIGKPLILVLDGLAEIPEEQSDLKKLLI